MEQEKKYANLFGYNPDISPAERQRVVKELQKIGSLTFTLEQDKNGWVAQCKEIPAIIAGNTNPSPSQLEIQSQIREAIFSAFNVKLESKLESSLTPFRFEYSTPSIQKQVV